MSFRYAITFLQLRYPDRYIYLFDRVIVTLVFQESVFQGIVSHSRLKDSESSSTTQINMNTKVSFTEYLGSLRTTNEIKTDMSESFVEDFKDMLEKKGCWIPHKRLEEYGLYKLDNSRDVRRILEKTFEEGFDYETGKVAGLRRSQGGSSVTNTYHLSSECFKMICMMSQNKVEGRKIRQYFLDMEKAVHYYAKYELNLEIENKNRIITDKQARLDTVTSQLDDANSKLDDLLRRSDMIINMNQDLKCQNSEIIEQNDELMEQNYVVQKKLDVAVEDRVPPLPPKSRLNSMLVIMETHSRSGSDAFYLIRRQERGLKCAIKLCKKKYSRAEEVLRITPQANPINFVNRIKLRIQSFATVEGSNLIILNSKDDPSVKSAMSKTEFLDLVKSMEDERLEVEVDSE